ncbi:MAG: cadherin repeat domain-containing protein [Ferruginibacter sp.]
MKASITFLLLLYINCTIAHPADTAVVEISATELPTVDYSYVKFSTPTKVVFKNLTRVNDFIIFYENSNLVSVEFPVLTSCGGYFYFSGNKSLKKISAPNLVSVADYLMVSGNTALAQLDVCSLQQIVPVAMSPEDNYYYIQDNTPAVDTKPFCFSRGVPKNVGISDSTILENSPAGSLIGTFSATGQAGDVFRYYLPDDQLDNRYFFVQGNKLYARPSFDYESAATYDIWVYTLNQVAEKTVRAFRIYVTNDPLEEATVVEIGDAVLPEITYSNYSFQSPVKLIYKNLVKVNGNVEFYNTINVAGVEFPKLDSVAGHFLFSSNKSLAKLSAPKLHTVSDYLFINSNKVLQQLDVCAVKQILPATTTPEQVYYDISGNTPATDTEAPCFSSGAPQNLLLSDTILNENQPKNTVIGTLSASTAAGGRLYYYLPESIEDNDVFALQDNKLVTGSAFDYETKSNYRIKIGCVNPLGEKTEKIFSITVNDIITEDTTILVINDTTLTTVFYSNRNAFFTTPTKLVFKNLVQVNEYIYLGQNLNLVSAEFPKLASAGGYFYVEGNPSLKGISAPALKTVTDYFLVAGNPSLVELDVCNLSQLLPVPGNPDPYYYISGNGIIDYGVTCFAKTNVIYIPETNIVVKTPPYTLIGRFVADTDTLGGSIRYYFADNSGKETTNPDFIIRGDSVFLARDYSTYTDTTFAIDVAAIRYNKKINSRSAKSIGTPASVTAALNEKIALKVNMGISKNAQFKNIWTGTGISETTSAWNNPSNWSRGVLPDAYTDVEINSGKVIVGTNVVCRSLVVKPNVQFTVKPGVIITILH